MRIHPVMTSVQDHKGEQGMRIGMTRTGLCAGILLAAALAAYASNDKGAPAPAKTGIGKNGGMAGTDMAGKSKMECKAESDSLASLLIMVQDAKKSGDNAKMKAALDATETHIAKMRDHMARCKGMMEMMGGKMMGSEGMKGDDERKGGPQGKDEAATPGSAKAAEASEHEKHHPK
jgi:hypothetical protein